MTTARRISPVARLIARSPNRIGLAGMSASVSSRPIGPVAPASADPAVAAILKDFPLFPSSLDSPSFTVRAVRSTFEAKEQSEGVGARVRRSIGTRTLRNLSPFLMLDHFSVGKGAGFPDHPHRGQETITYLIDGAVDHEDFTGSKGTIRSGDLQFMTAGRGIVHAEMPAAESGEKANVGMQLWVDLPASLKDTEPRYRDLRAEEIPVAESADRTVSVKVISGRSFGIESVRDLAYTPVWYLDITIRPGGRLEQEIPAGWTGFAYVLSGTADFGGEMDGRPSGDAGRTVEPVRVGQYHLALFDPDGDRVVATNPDEKAEARFVLIAGVPLDQPIVQYGPFVVTDQAGVAKAMMDFQLGANGFERAPGWRSQIGRRMADRDD